MRDKQLEDGEVEAKLEILREAVKTGDDDTVKSAMKKVVPTYINPEELNNN